MMSSDSVADIFSAALDHWTWTALEIASLFLSAQRFQGVPLLQSFHLPWRRSCVHLIEQAASRTVFFTGMAPDSKTGPLRDSIDWALRTML